MIQRILSTIAIFVVFSVTAAQGQHPLESTQQKAAQAKSAQTVALAEADGLTPDKQRIIREIMNEKYRLTWLKYRQEKTRQYIARAKQAIDDLEYKKEEFDKMRVQLEPYLADVLLRLEDFIARDLPFWPDERSQRLAGIEKTLGDPDLPLGKKLGVVFEVGLGIETEYGKGVDANENRILNIDGVDTDVVLFRLGRVGMYYMSLDETKTGFYNKLTGNWDPLPDGMKRKIKLAVKIGQRERTVEILTLPLQDLGNPGDMR